MKTSKKAEQSKDAFEVAHSAAIRSLCGCDAVIRQFGWHKFPGFIESLATDKYGFDWIVCSEKRGGSKYHHHLVSKVGGGT